MFTEKDLNLLTDKGISPDQVEKQIMSFKSGIKPVKLNRPAVPDDGIQVFDEGGVLMYAGIYDKKSASLSKIKFVPASGAASRMFKDLFSALEEMHSDPGHQDVLLEKNVNLKNFFSSIQQYAFYNDLKIAALQSGQTIDNLIVEKKYAEILSILLNEPGLNYGAKPKGVLKFHKYDNQVLTALEEHVNEAHQFLVNENKSLCLHFTVSPEHLGLFSEISDTLVLSFKKSGIDLKVSYSVQAPSTDTIAVDMQNNPFRENSGSMHFRPGGHGALLLNLGSLQEDLIFIGNIDNICTERDRPRRVLYKKFLGGFLIEKVHIIRQLLHSLVNGYNLAVRNDVIRLIQNYISFELADKIRDYEDEEFVQQAFRILDRPVRVCGMVKNTGEPGGGPFWIQERDGNISKQIIESSQIDLENPEQNKIFNSSTHFNPVDIVCSIKDYRGITFDLSLFRDDEMAFIAKKSFGGRELKALELPGLWNGSMAGWITFFVEVPVETFTPVKTVFDLIRPEHIA